MSFQTASKEFPDFFAQIGSGFALEDKARAGQDKILCRPGICADDGKSTTHRLSDGDTGILSSA
jgi:hypothetical protein